ncbi:rho guanine nucleotide exchange factor 10-like isoform X2 [Watersipora subatra]|uniref:rho guanine nucleotide exchange factor 10-like isoform X2 n=1 Tax=Watersipora subatra TaxID=2589382 RepID=UPI00355C00C4
MFRIALHDRMKNWDEHEVIGSEFSEISKDFVLEVYSEFINNFMKATELLKKSMKDKTFSEFVNAQMKASNDMVGPHGLMIKVVQRFPQYILQIKDLLKNTPTDHDDHLKLYLALSRLENVAYQLNVKKRTSEERLAARLLLSRISKSNEMKNPDSILFRQDDVNEVTHGSGGTSKEKPRRLLLFNDMICLISLDNRSGIQTLEKIQLKWSCPVRDVEFHESGASPNTNSLVHSASGAVLIQSSTIKQRKIAESNVTNQTTAAIHRELDDLMHDQTILAQIMSLTSSLKQEYQGLNADQLQDQLKNIQTSIRIRDEQLQMVDSCLICLSYIKNGHRINDIFNMGTPERKQDWVMDFRAVKLSQEPINEPSKCWLTEEPKINYPLVIRDVDVDVTSMHTQVKCATSIFLTNTSGGIGLQYLWVCSSNDSSGQVTLLSVHSNQPHIIECFPACTGPITCCALVPSNIHCSLDHVWMADSNRNIFVHSLRVGEWRKPYRKFSVLAEVKDMCCYDNHVFLALADGSIMKYAKRKGSSLYTQPTLKKLPDIGNPVSALLACDNNKLLAACGNTLYTLSTVGALNILDRHQVQDLPHCIDKMIKLGLGIWFSCVNDPNLRLIHHETYRSISEMHIGRSLCRLLPTETESISSSHVGITALSSSQGLIWVGCSTGHILTIPVPVLEGIPQQSGKVNLSSICHSGPVGFISTMNCCITLSPQALPDDLESSASSSLAEDDVNDAADEMEADRSSTTSPHKPRSLSLFKTKLFDRLGGNHLKQAKNVGASTPNLASLNAGLRRSSMGIYDSLMRLDDLDSPSSTTDWVNSLVPTNPLPRERHCSKISTLRGNGKVRVTRSSSISDLEPSILRPASSRRTQVQSMWALHTTSSHSLSSEAGDTDEVSKAKSKALDKAHNDVNVELRNKFGSLSRFDKKDRTLSVNSLLSRVAEDEELIEESDEFEDSFEEKEEENPHNAAKDAEENEEALVVTNFLKASLIISGGEGLHNIHEPTSDLTNSTVIMWQQNQT